MENNEVKYIKGDFMKSNIVLIGISGVGKTTIGMELAKRLEKRFYDIDAEIEKNIGLSIHDIFKKYGEEHFRIVESRIVTEVACYDECIISTGGGIVLNPQNINALKEKGIIICLYATPEAIYERVKGNQDRPLYKNGELYEKIKDLQKERENLYKCADIYINTAQRDINDIVNEILLHKRKGIF